MVVVGGGAVSRAEQPVSFRPVPFVRVRELTGCVSHIIFSLHPLAAARFVMQHEESHGLDPTFNFSAYLTKSIRLMLLDLIEVRIPIIDCFSSA